mmetsp:Transcript_46814/g.141803  ORF Transcript_46814/g.141803 Transcript_46814/m.141803 type:complete len:403 (+) Transcript_46814:1444-2652(+)
MGRELYATPLLRSRFIVAITPVRRPPTGRRLSSPWPSLRRRAERAAAAKPRRPAFAPVCSNILCSRPATLGVRAAEALGTVEISPEPKMRLAMPPPPLSRVAFILPEAIASLSLPDPPAAAAEMAPEVPASRRGAAGLASPARCRRGWGETAPTPPAPTPKLLFPRAEEEEVETTGSESARRGEPMTDDDQTSAFSNSFKAFIRMSISADAAPLPLPPPPSSVPSLSSSSRSVSTSSSSSSSSSSSIPRRASMPRERPPSLSSSSSSSSSRNPPMGGPSAPPPSPPPVSEDSRRVARARANRSSSSSSSLPPPPSAPPPALPPASTVSGALFAPLPPLPLPPGVTAIAVPPAFVGTEGAAAASAVGGGGIDSSTVAACRGGRVREADAAASPPERPSAEAEE